MAKKNKAGATRPCPHCSKPVHPRCKTCPHCRQVIRAAAKKTSPPQKRVAVKARAKATPTDLVGQPKAENAKLEEDDWIDRLLPTYD